MSLSKGATFHVPSSPPTEDSPVLSIRHLARRSPTSSQASLISLLFEKEEGAARSIQDFEHTFSGARGKQRAHRRGVNEASGRRGVYTPAHLPSDEGLGSSASTPTDKDLTRVFERALDLDSGLGSSIKTESAKETHVRAGGETSEEDGLSVGDLIQGVVKKEPQIRQRSIASEAQSAIVRSISPMTSSTPGHSHLSNFARKQFADNILQPILREDRFKIFHPLVSTLGSRTNKAIKCLRDLEQSLICEPLRLAISHTLYRSFGEFSVQLVLDTFHHLSEQEQRRASDRPYDNGYFLDLVQQVGRLAAQMDYSPDDEVTLEGGLSQTGRPAELVRWKNGEGVSLRTNERYEAQPLIKRQRSNESLDDDAERSMARRKKNAEPKTTELRCSDRTCDKIFNRKCDLAKHEKTHSRPFKCPEKTCKYHDQGLPTEKERDRHVNDKHSTNPRYFHCKYCVFKTKRDSNCKQHMEKKHGWTYERVKGNAKSARTPQQTPQTPSMSTPSISDDWGNTSVYGSDGGSNFTPYTTSLDDFGDTMQPPTNPYQVSLFPTNPTPPSRTYGYGSPELNFNSSPYGPGCSAPLPGNVNFTSPYAYNQGYLDTPLTPAHTTGPAFNVTSSNPLHIDIDYQGDFSAGLPTPGSHSLQPQSRNPSISGISPMIAEDDLFQPPPQPSHPADHTMSNTYTGMTDLPNDDFALFGVSGDPSMVPSTADVSYEHMDMFSNMETEYSDSQLGRYLNL
ncbi:hypothetical protein GJ744_008552 [Endocarpon pusillum]|uniref:C2H2-type domain-containing protein n=1 Tax=Endocarpon pusillum TaxID=364733 RepID=A0A8H7AKY2_9EURO|nr:hypothetical protein GJ744_008552 [Endocarpon pusillum]